MTALHRLLVPSAAAWLIAAAGPTLAQSSAPPIAERQVLAGISGPVAEDADRAASPVAADGDTAASAVAKPTADKSRNQAIARALLLLMGGGGAGRPFPLLPK